MGSNVCIIPAIGCAFSAHMCERPLHDFWSTNDGILEMFSECLKIILERA